MDALAAGHDAYVQMIDTSSMRVHQHGACTMRNRRQSIGRPRGGLSSKMRLRQCSIDLLFRRLCAFDYVTLGEKNTSELGPPVLVAAEQELQVHTEVLEFFLLRVRHDCFGLLVPFDRHPLFVPAYGFRFLDQ